MPFTLSHPAAVLPLLRRPFVPVALIAGAMVPDLPYFLDIPVTAESWYEPFVNATFSHSFQGLLLVGLPGVVLVALLFHLVRRPIGDLLPWRLHITGHDTLQPRTPLAYGLWFLISALIGLATHLIWDSLTEVGNGAYRILQHGSTAVGMIIIVVWCVRRFRTRDVSIERVTVSKSWVLQRAGIALAIILVSAAFAVLAVKEVQNLEGSIGLEHTVSLLLKSGMRIAVIAVVIYALVWYSVHLSRKFRAQQITI